MVLIPDINADLNWLIAGRNDLGILNLHQYNLQKDHDRYGGIEAPKSCLELWSLFLDE